MSMPPRLSEVGDVERRDHCHLPASARCYFWGEYTPFEHTQGKKWAYSPTNRLICNFKKKMDRRGQPDWPYKQQAIQTVARAFAGFWNWDVLHTKYRAALVPMPPSKARKDALYDPRMMDMLTQLERNVGKRLDIRDCLSFSGAHVASHETKVRCRPDELHAELEFDISAGELHRSPGTIVLFDDLLTTGAHYAAAARRLNDFFPEVGVIGAFVARRITLSSRSSLPSDRPSS